MLCCHSFAGQIEKQVKMEKSLPIPYTCLSFLALLWTVVICLAGYYFWFWTRASWLCLLYKHQTRKKVSQPPSLYNIKGIGRQKVRQTDGGMQQSDKISFLNQQQPDHCQVFCRYHEKGCKEPNKFTKLKGSSSRAGWPWRYWESVMSIFENLIIAWPVDWLKVEFNYVSTEWKKSIKVGKTLKSPAIFFYRRSRAVGDVAAKGLSKCNRRRHWMLLFWMNMSWDKFLFVKTKEEDRKLHWVLLEW